MSDNQQDIEKTTEQDDQVDNFVRRKAKVINCRYFKQYGKAMGGCKHPKATSACLYRYIDECPKSERKEK